MLYPDDPAASDGVAGALAEMPAMSPGAATVAGGGGGGGAAATAAAAVVASPSPAPAPAKIPPHSPEVVAEKSAGKGRAAADGSDDAGAVADAEAARQAAADLYTSPHEMFFDDLSEFVHSPAPEGITMQCEMIRMKKGSFGRHPVYHFKLQRKKKGREQKCMLLAARRRKKAMSNNFVISLDPTDLEPHGESAVGKLRSNKKANEFTLFDTGYNQKKTVKAIAKQVEKRKALRRTSLGLDGAPVVPATAEGGGGGGGGAAEADAGTGDEDDGAIPEKGKEAKSKAKDQKKDAKAKAKEEKKEAKAKEKEAKAKEKEDKKKVKYAVMKGASLENAVAPGEVFEARKELAHMHFKNVKHQASGPKVRQLTGAIPGIREDGGVVEIRPNTKEETIGGRLDSGTADVEKHAAHAKKSGIMLLNNKSPEWNSNLNAYALNFNGRVLKASVKNIQLVDQANPDEILLQFGRVSDDVFHVDYRFPLNAIQAFGICLTTFAAHQGPL